MNLETIEQSTTIDVPRSWRSDPDVSSYFLALYQQLVLQSSVEVPLRIIGITSCQRGAGVSTVAGQLAIAAAEAGKQKVLLVDANLLARPSHDVFSPDDGPGLLNLLDGSHALDQVLQPTSLDNLWTLGLGTPTQADLAADLRSTAREFLSGLALEFSFIVLDLPPVEYADDVLGLTGAIDGTVLVVEAERTKGSLARAATEALSRTHLLGAVLNKRQEPD